MAESNSEEFKEGDEVILTGCRVGELFHGGFSQYARVKKEFLIKKPDGINLKQAMMMGTAGFTAMLCAFAVKAKEEISQYWISYIDALLKLNKENEAKIKKEYATILAFDVRVTPEAQKFAEEEGIKIFTAKIIYHLFDDFTAYVK